ncbi:hypothetical protein HMPREF1994_00001, partial [Fusobacterium phage Funu2]
LLVGYVKKEGVFHLKNGIIKIKKRRIYNEKIC